MKRRMFAWLLIVCLALTVMPVTARAETQTITVWVEETNVDWAQERLQAFSQLYPQYTFSVQVCSLYDAESQAAADPAGAADVYGYGSDALSKLLKAGALAPFPDAAVRELTAQNGETMMATVTAPDGKVYGAPYAGHTWYMFYNKNVFSEEDVKSLDTMLEKGVVSFPMTTPWYFASFYFANGCTMFGPNGNDAAARIQFGGVKGTQVTDYLVDLVKHPNFRSDENGMGLEGMQDGSIHACFTGSWDYGMLHNTLGDSLGAAQPPTANIGGSPKQLKAFCSSKAYGVNAHSKHPQVAQALALYLSNPESQKLLYQQCGVIPTAKTLIHDTAIQSDIRVAAQMNTFANAAAVQPSVPEMGVYWGEAFCFSERIMNGDVTHANAACKTREFYVMLNNIYEIDGGSCGENAYWALESDGTLVIYGTGAATETPWREEYSTRIKHVVVEDGITALPELAFENYPALQSASLGSSLAGVPFCAFQRCTALSRVTLAEGIGYLGTGAFCGCTSLTQITLPNTMTSLGTGAFQGSGLTSLVLPDSVEYLGEDVLRECPNLKTVTVGKGLESLFSYHFFKSTALEAIHVSPANPNYTSQDGVVYTNGGKTLCIYPAGKPGAAFRVPGFVEIIPDGAFLGIEGLKTLEVPGTVKRIDSYAIDGVEEIKFLGDPPELDHAFNAYEDITCYYPSNNAAWDDVIAKSYSAKVTWIPYDPPVKIETTPMYRLYNPNSGEHFYTGSLEERDVLTAAGWAYEGVAWNAPTKTGTPVYRLYNPNSGDHHYTMSAEERDMLVGYGWQYEGICWNSASSENLPLYRLYNPNADCGSHHYTGSEEERDTLEGYGWIYEGIGWFGMLN